MIDGTKFSNKCTIFFLQPAKKKGGASSSRRSDGFTSEELDLDREIHPIGYFIKDRNEMVKQMFSALKKPKLMSMLPEILKV